eukprot:7637636-Pyramimonas_sp.AAC.1
MLAGVVIRGQQRHNIKASFQYNRVSIVVLARPCVFLVSAYFPHADRDDALEVQSEMLLNIRNAFTGFTSKHGSGYKL